MSEIGSLELSPIHRFDWVIKSFEAWAEAHKSKGAIFGPKFFVHGLEFGLVFRTNPEKDRSYIWLKNYSKMAVEVAFYSLQLVGRGGEMKEILWIKGYKLREEDKGIIWANNIESKFLTNGDLRIRY